MVYDYEVTEVVKVTDGDTYWLQVDVGFRETVLINVRLNGYDCPELHSSNIYERERANDAKEFATTWFQEHVKARVTTEKDPDSFGRWLGDVYCNGVHLGQELHQEGLATIWPKRWHEEYS
jgi:endonuclease YncB( thermonuclease family)